MTKHMWVNLTYTPIEIEAQGDGTLHTFTTDLAESLAADDSALICFACGEHLTTANYDAECEPEVTQPN